LLLLVAIIVIIAFIIRFIFAINLVIIILIIVILCSGARCAIFARIVLGNRSREALLCAAALLPIGAV